MLYNIYILYKIIVFAFLKGYVIRNYYEFYKYYSDNSSIVLFTKRYYACNLWFQKKCCFCVKFDLDVNTSKNDICIYIVKPGDTLRYIAWVTGNNYLELAKINNIKNIDLLKVNQVLHVKRDVVRAFFSKYFSRRILLFWYKNHFKVKNLFFSKKDDFYSKPDINTSHISAKNTFYYSQYVNNKTLSNWHWPTDGLVIDTFSEKEGGNKGIDISGVFDQPVLAATNGRVVYVGNVLKGYGNLVIIKHDKNYLSAYAHNNKILVIEQQKVKIGDKIATMGSSGTNRVKLHFEIRYKGKSINPLNVLP